MIYLIFGKDEFSCEEALHKLMQEHAAGIPGAEWNRTLLEGGRLSLSELRHHCDSLPFLGERRLVIVRGLLARLSGGTASASEEEGQEAAQEGPAAFARALLEYLPALPPTTDLVLYDPGLEGKAIRSRILEWARKQSELCRVWEFTPKRGKELMDWMARRAGLHGAKMDAGAQSALANAVGEDLRTLDQEITKLALYAGPGGTITAEHVRLLTPHTRESSIFVIVDAISERRWQTAIAEMRKLMEEGAHPQYIFHMIYRQFSLIAQAKGLEGERLSPAALAKKLGVHQFTAEKVQKQAMRYRKEELQSIYDRLLEADLAVKTGQMEPAVALEWFIVRLTKTPQRA